MSLTCAAWVEAVLLVRSLGNPLIWLRATKNPRQHLLSEGGASLSGELKIIDSGDDAPVDYEQLILFHALDSRGASRERQTW